MVITPPYIFDVIRAPMNLGEGHVNKRYFNTACAECIYLQLHDFLIHVLVLFDKNINIFRVHEHFLADLHVRNLGIPDHTSPKPYGTADFRCQLLDRKKTFRVYGWLRLFCCHPLSE